MIKRLAYFGLAAWAIATTIMVMRLNGRVYELEEEMELQKAITTVYLAPDEHVVECYRQAIWREKIETRDDVRQ